MESQPMDTSLEPLTAERLRQLLCYNPGTGEFRRGARLAGTTNGRGYRQIRVGARIYFAHRLAVLFVTGEWPPSVVDHIDGNPLNNRIANLRAVTQAANAQNIKRAHRDNATGRLGVERAGRLKYQARITVQGKRVGLGVFKTPEAAHAAYLTAKRALHEGNTL